MERKLVKQGKNALTVTLPAKWLKIKGLEAGHVVKILEQDSELILSSPRTAQRRTIELQVRDLERSMMFHMVMGKYIEGYDTIILHHNNSKLTHEVSQYLLGMIIEEHSSTRTVFKSVIVVPEDNFMAVLRRATQILCQQAIAVEELAKHKGTLKQVKTQEQLLDYNLLYCLRYLNKYERTSGAYKYFLLCSTLESAGDQLSQIAKHITGHGRIATKVRKGVEEYTSLLFSGKLPELYTSLRNFRSSVGERTFVEGLAFALAETLYNYLGYIVEWDKGKQ